MEKAQTTPVGGHVSVMLAEAVDALVWRRDGVYVDCTFGRGGHSREILRRLDAAGRLIAFDRDPEAVAAARAVNDERFVVRHAAFSGLSGELDALAVRGVDGVLLDLGVSSPQLDDARRGMSFRQDAPLDMRMDTSQGEGAAQWLRTASIQEMTEVFRNYGEE
ncbi:MAG: 16S rRNA (cytosine(1402)-N(4))-methyltransferase RsmH, partial [Rhodocyclaceae bacterium]|nr:16S rRNA (cytosine(1402)-N(4))-methyltransferase RsmH [Rhodocyclaceae bacterium]